MAGGAEILQEYVVKLGFLTDKIGLKKFGEGLDAVSSAVFGVGSAIAGMAVAAEAAVGKFANNMEELHYTSQLAGSSANNMKALEVAGKAVGLMGDQLSNGVKSLNLQLIDGTGRIQAFAASMGVATKGRETVDIYNDLAIAIRKMAKEQGVTGPSKNFAKNLLGLGDEEYQLLINTPGKIEAVIAAEKEQIEAMRVAGINYDEAGDKSVKYMKSLRNLGTALFNTSGIILGYAEPAFEKLNNVLAESANWWGKFFQDPAKVLKNAVPHAYQNNNLTDDNIKFQKMDAFNNSNQTADDIKFQKMGAFNNKKATRGIRNNNPGNLNFARQQGASKESGANGRFAIFNSMQEGIAALERQIAINVNKHGLNTLAKFVHSYAPAGDKNNESAYIKALQKETGLGANDNIDLSNKKIASGIRNGIIAHENNGYRLASIEQTKLGASKSNTNASLVQNNTFNIQGADGKALSKSVVAAQSRTNGDALRALSTRVS